MKRNYSWSLVIAGAVVLTACALIGDGRLWGQKAEGQDIDVAGGTAVYMLTVNGEQMGYFYGCSGLGSSNEIDSGTVVLPSGMAVMQLSPGALKAHKITLQAGEPGNLAVWQWRRMMDSGGFNSAVRDGQIMMFDGSLTQPTAAWVFHRGWPASLMFEDGRLELVIAHEGLEMMGTSAGGGGVAPKGRTK